MKTNNSTDICACLNCDEAIEEGDRVPCPKCGSMGRRWNTTIEERTRIREAYKLKIGRQGFPSKKKIRYEEFSGSEKRKADGEWVDKLQIFDREQDLYVEKVTLEATGEVLRDVCEPLSQHTGHGSAKFKAAPKEQAQESSGQPDPD